jgi:hypothetical protein
MDTDIDIAEAIPAYGLDRAGGDTRTALYAEIFFDNHPPTGPIREGAGGTDGSARCGIAGQAPVGGKAGGKATGGVNANPGSLPGDPFMYQSGTGHGAGLTADTLVHARRCKLFHFPCCFLMKGLLE